MALIAFAPIEGPTAVWRHSAIGAGRSQLTEVRSANELEALSRRFAAGVFAQRDGVESTVAVTRDDGLAFIVNGKSDGHLLNDRGTQVMSGLIGAALHPEPKRALVVGLGTGSSAGWLAQVPSIERVDVAELEPAILDIARVMRPANMDPLRNPKVHVFVGDAREYLLSSDATYDIIFSEPSNPYRAGVSSLYTREYYEAARARLGPQGFFLQWLQTYEVQSATVRGVLVTLASVFPELEVWRTQAGDVVLLASASPVPHRADVLRARLAQEPFASALRLAWRTEGLEGFLAHHIAGPQVSKALVQRSKEPLNTDDHNRIEFAFARSVGMAEGLPDDELPAVAQQLGALRPTVTGGAVDWGRVAEEAAFSVLSPDFVMEQLDERGRARLAAFSHSPADAASRWLEASFEPVGAIEVMTLAWGLADRGRDEAKRFIDQLGGFPVEQRIVSALLLLRQDNAAGALEATGQAVLALRASPWCERAFGLVLFNTLIPTLAQRDPVVAQNLFALLAPPLANYAFEEKRLRTRLDLTAGGHFEKLCREAVTPFEPFVPWERTVLQARADCYRATSSPLAVAARADLERFIAGEPAAMMPPP